MGSRITLRGIECVVVDCGVCGIPYTVPANVYEHNQDAGGYSHCPNGHAWGWEKSKSQRAREEREREAIRQERDRLKQNAAYLEEQIRVERASREAVEIREKKLKKRTANGVCPCCTRSFVNLRRHVATKHPEFAAENVVPLKAANGDRT